MRGVFSDRPAQAATTPSQAPANVRLADAVGDGLEGQRDASRLIESIRGGCGDGHELRRAVDAIAPRSPAYRLGFLRCVQKAIERAAP